MPHHLAKDHKSRLTPSPPTRVALFQELIETFIQDHRWTRLDRITWTMDKAKSELVVSQDRSLRIDFQKPFNATCPDCIADQRRERWANLALQGGDKTYACVLMEMHRPYPAGEVRQAWLDSLKERLNAHMEWSFVATKFEFAVLRSLDARQPRTSSDIVSEMQRNVAWGYEERLGLYFQTPSLIRGTPGQPEGLLNQVLRDLVGAGLADVRRMRPRNVEAWTITPLGTQNLAKAANNPVLRAF
jgi:hypothetical protein